MTWTVYLAGPLSDGDDSFKWHRQVEEMDSSIEWINPFTIHSDDATEQDIYRGDLAAILESDAILLRRIDGYEVCGAYIEAGFAGANDIPTVVWNAADTTPPEFLKWHAEAICDSLESAIVGVSP